MAFPIAPSTSPGTGPLNAIEDIQPQERAQLEIKVEALVAKLEKEAERRVTEKRQVEQRWIAESYQYSGRYERLEEESIKSSATMHRSFVYMNETRRKTRAMEDRIVDIEFPTDDRNFSIGPTSVPELSDEAMAWAKFAAENQQKLLEVPEGDPAAAEALNAQRIALQRATEAQSVVDEARRRADNMQNEMDDQLQETGYNFECKLMTHDACKLGTGIMKGPVLASDVKQAWSKRTDEQSGFEVHEMISVESPRPAFYRVDPWNWFPDMDAVRLSESDGFYERHLMTSSALRKLARTPGFNADVIRKLLKQKPKGSAPQYMSDLRGIVGDESVQGFKDRYHVWEYHGPIESDDMESLNTILGDGGGLGYDGELDPLEEINVTVWFCQGEVLKFGIHPLDSGEPIYSVFNFEKDDHSIFGFGVPHLMANPQKVLCAAWRMMVDNAALATAPQIIFNNSTVEPYDGDYIISPGKLWMKKSGMAPGEKPFETFHLDIRQAEMERIIALALESIDREIGVPTITDAEPGQVPMQTALGISIFSSETKIPFRALVKHFDDNITIPNMRRLFEWNMQFSDKEHIKGDMRVAARGTSTFLLRELQAPALMTMLVQFASHPVLGPAMNVMPMVRKLAQAMLLPQNEVIKSDEKLAADLAAAAAEEQPEPSPEQMRAESERIRAEALVEAAKLRFEAAKYTSDTNHKIEVMRMEMSGNANLEQLEMKKEIKEKELQSKERQQAADMGLTQQMGKPTGGGWS